MWLWIWSICFHPSDKDECREGACQGGQCYNTRGSFRCHCPVGFDISSDGLSCIGTVWSHSRSLYNAIYTSFPYQVAKAHRYTSIFNLVINQKKTVWSSVSCSIHIYIKVLQQNNFSLISMPTCILYYNVLTISLVMMQAFLKLKYVVSCNCKNDCVWNLYR